MSKEVADHESSQSSSSDHESVPEAAAAVQVNKHKRPRGHANTAAHPSPPQQHNVGMRATHVGTSFIVTTASAAGQLSELGVTVGSSPAARVFEGQLRELEQALIKLTKEADVIGDKAKALRLHIDEVLQKRQDCLAAADSTVATAAAVAPSTEE